MPTNSLSCLIAPAALIAMAAGLQGQIPDPAARDALLEMLVWGADAAIDVNAYPPELRSELQAYLQRYNAYQPRRPRPAKPGLDRMVYTARVRYERKLSAVSPDPRAPELAAEYVDALRPCYEWEGLHDCPEREARFAEGYLKAHPGGPFSEYLRLLAADRWLCTAEAYEHEKRPADAARSRQAYEQAISVARKSKMLLVRVAAQRWAGGNGS